MAARKDPLHAHHTFAIAPTNGFFDRLLVCYVSGARAEALSKRKAEGQVRRKILKSDAAPSLPRSFSETPGRHYMHMSHPENTRLHENGPASRARARTVTESRVRLLLFLSWLGMAPQPGDGSLHREWCDKDGKMRGACLTAQRTWEAFRAVSTKEAAISALACLKGYCTRMTGTNQTTSPDHYTDHHLFAL